MNLAPQQISLLTERGFRASDEQFVTQRRDRLSIALTAPDGSQVIAKQLPSERAATLFANMRLVWDSSFGATRTPPGSPRPLECLSEHGFILMERVPGRPLAETGVSEKHFAASIELIAALHASNARAESERTSRRIVRSLHRKADSIAARESKLGELARNAVAAAETNRPKDTELVPTHGDYSPRNILAADDRLTLIDWERFQMADPARDVAYFATWPWLEQLKRGRMPDKSLLKDAIKLYEQARPGASLRKQIRFHVAAGLIRRAASLVELWPEQSYMAPPLLKTALRQFE